MSEQPNENIVSIEQLNTHIRDVLRKGFANSQFKIIGSVGSIFTSRKGNIFIDLLDDNQNGIRCFVHNRNTDVIGFTIENGMRIEVVGIVGFYDRESKIRIEVEGVRLIERSVLKNYEQIRAKLRERQLLPKPKKKLPKKINKIALVSGYASAAIDDFRVAYQDLGGKAAVQPVEVPLQGNSAAREIADTIRRLNSEADVVAIVLARGGGSTLDLGVFDDFLVAEAILESKIPVLTGIGHEKDRTFADEISDMQGGTPSIIAQKIADHEKEMAGATLSERLNIIFGIIIAIAVVVILLLLTK